MTIEEQVQAEAINMMERYDILLDGIATQPALDSLVKACALIEIEKIISLRVPPMEHYEQVKQAIINYNG